MADRDLDQIFRDALALVDRTELPPELRGVGFQKAVEVLLESSVSGARPAETKAAPPIQSSTPIERAGRLSSRLGLDLAVVQEAYDLSEKTVQIVVPRSKLGLDKAQATRTLAILLAAGRQGASYDSDWTSLDLIREECRQFNVLDPSNFAATISGLTEFFLFRGSPRRRELKLTRTGFEEATRLVRKLTGDGK